jgi:hypothetical protein
MASMAMRMSLTSGEEQGAGLGATNAKWKSETNLFSQELEKLEKAVINSVKLVNKKDTN